MAFDGEAQPDGVARCGVGVLANDQHANVGKRRFEGAKDAIAGGEVVAPRGEFGAMTLVSGGCEASFMPPAYEARLHLTS